MKRSLSGELAADGPRPDSAPALSAPATAPCKRLPSRNPTPPLVAIQRGSPLPRVHLHQLPPALTIHTSSHDLDLPTATLVRDLAASNLPCVVVLYGLSSELLLAPVAQALDGFRAVCVAVTAHVDSAAPPLFPYPIASDPSGSVARALGCLDPLGGGVYPRDTLVVFDAAGHNVLQVTVSGCSALWGRGRAYRQWLDAQQDHNRRHGRLEVTHEHVRETLAEVMVWMARRSS